MIFIDFLCGLHYDMWWKEGGADGADLQEQAMSELSKRRRPLRDPPSAIPVEAVPPRGGALEFVSLVES